MFQGNRSGELAAFNDSTGEQLWSTLTQAGVMAAPSTFMVGDEQYIAQLVGSPALPEEGPGAAVANTDLSTNNSRLLVYRIGGDASLPEMPDPAEIEAAPAELPQIDASNEMIAQGESAYNRNCSVCHGPFAVSIRLDTYPDLRMSGRLGDAEAWHAVVMEGELADSGMASLGGNPRRFRRRGDPGLRDHHGQSWAVSETGGRWSRVLEAYEPNALSILPPLLAILLAIATRQVVVSLGIGIWAGFCLSHSLDPLRALPLALDGVINVFADPGDTRVLIFTLAIGGLIATIEQMGGVRGFIRLLESGAWVNNGWRAKWLAYFTGIVVFVESNITLLVAGAISRPLFDHYRISREKLAYIIDSTSAPVCILIPLNAWGAIVLALLSSSAIENPVEVFITAIPLNFYALLAILFCAFAIWRNLDLGPMREAEQRTADGELLWAQRHAHGRSVDSRKLGGRRRGGSGALHDRSHRGNGAEHAIVAAYHRGRRYHRRIGLDLGALGRAARACLLLDACAV